MSTLEEDLAEAKTWSGGPVGCDLDDVDKIAGVLGEGMPVEGGVGNGFVWAWKSRAEDGAYFSEVVVRREVVESHKFDSAYCCALWFKSKSNMFVEECKYWTGDFGKKITEKADSVRGGIKR